MITSEEIHGLIVTWRHYVRAGKLQSTNKFE